MSDCTHDWFAGKCCKCNLEWNDWAFTRIAELKRELAEARESAEKAHALYNDCADKLIACEESKADLSQIAAKMMTERDQWREVAAGLAEFSNPNDITFNQRESNTLKDLLARFHKLKEASR